MEKLYKIGELASNCNTTLKTIRYYEEKGLIKHTKIDKDNGYHYYNFEALVSLQNILKLRDLGFSLKEIKNYTQKSNKEKIDELEKLQTSTNEKIKTLISIEYTNIYRLPYFINDEEALGLWKSIAYSNSINEYKSGNFKTNVDNMRIKYLFFLNRGKGFDKIKDWSKGVVNVGSKHTYSYTIEKDILYLNIVDQTTGEHIQTVIYERLDNIKREHAEPIFKDNMNLDFIKDPEVLGLWEIYDAIHPHEKEKYDPSTPKDMKSCFFQSIIFKTNGKCIREEFASFLINSYTKGKVLNKKLKTASDYKIITINKDKYLLLDYKSEEYIYDNIITWTYVFKKAK